MHISEFGSVFGRAFCENLRSKGQYVVGANRLLPPRVINATPTCALDVSEKAIHEQSHADRRRVPPACDEASKHGVLGCFLIDMEWLRIIPLRKLHNLILGVTTYFRQ
jgi:hypothetical protein